MSIGNLNEVETPEQKSTNEISQTPEAAESEKDKLEKPETSDINNSSIDEAKQPEDKLEEDERKQVSPDLTDKGKETDSDEEISRDRLKRRGSTHP